MSHVSFFKKLSKFQFFRVHIPLLPPFHCILHLANCLLCHGCCSTCGHVQFLHPFTPHPRRAFPCSYSFEATFDLYSFILSVLQEDIQTISWPEIVRRIGAIREENPLTAISSSKRTNTTATAKLDAHDIANRIMRQENYLIALFNKDLLDLHVPLPSAIKHFVGHDGDTGQMEGGKGMVLTRTLEWNLRFCLMEFLFDARGRVRKVFLKSKNRTSLIEG